MKDLTNFKNQVDYNGLKLIQINSDGNDYPRGLGSYGAIGFDTYKNAKEFSEKNGGEVYLFKTRQGHSFWRALGAKYEPLTADDYLNDCNDNVYETNEKDQIERFWEQLEDVINDQDFEELQSRIEQRKKDIEYIESLKGDEVVFYDGNCNSLGAIPSIMMEYSYDVYVYAIGVYFNPEIHEEEEEPLKD